MTTSRMSLINSPHDAERAFSPSRSRSDHSNIRGRISGPIPIVSPLDDDFPIRNQPPEDGLPHASAIMSFEPGAPGRGENRNQTPTQSIHMRSRSSPIGPTGLRSTNGQQRDTPSALRQSAFSIGTSGSKSSPQRKKSILRGALGRLFGRKKNAGSQGTRSDESSRPTPDSWAQQHRNTVLATPIAENPSTEQRQSTPFTDDDYGRALRSHTVEDKDRSAIERSRTLVHTDSNFSRRRPGGSGVLSIRERQAVTGELGGLTPRPASVHARLSSQEFASSNPEDIGRAITSDCSGLKRRSRSLSAITGFGNLDGRRSRSGDIRYWRQSHDPEYKSPVASSYHHEAEDKAAETVETPPVQGDETVPPSPLQPFSFGDMASMNQMAGMKITEAATIESRLGRFEERMSRLERSLSGLTQASPGYEPLCNGHGPRMDFKVSPPVSYRLSPSSAKPPVNQGLDAIALQPSPSFASSRLGGNGWPSEAQSPVMSSERPLSTSTIRATASLPSLTQELNRPLTGEHYTTLMALLDTERSARQALEAQVKTLGHQISILTKASNSQDKSRRSSKQKSAFDYDYEDEAEDEDGTNQGQYGEDRFLNSQDSSMNTQAHEDEDDSTSYATSADEDGEVYYESPSYAKTARTLSLSQLTFNRPVAKTNGEPMPNVI